jgi:nicotinamidase-related amidase
MNVAVPEYKTLPEVKLDPRWAALVVVDMQNDFVSPKGRLCVSEARRTIPNILKLIYEARKAKCPIFFTQDWHRPDDPEFSLWPLHAVAETPGARVVPQLKPLPVDFFIRKKTYDAFFGTEFDLILRQKRIRNLVITGTVANICVLHTAGSACLHGYGVVVPQDAVSSLTPFDQAAALRQISFVYQGKITRSSGIKFLKTLKR